MVYKRVGILTPQHNLHKNLLQRQFAASKYIELLESDKVLVNIDESTFRQTDNRKMSWIATGSYNVVSYSQRLNQVNIIAAVTSDGRCMFTVN